MTGRVDRIAHLTSLKNLIFDGRFSAAATQCDRLIEGGDGRAEIYAFRGAALEGLGWFHEALENYDQAVAIDSTYSAAVRDRGLLRLRMGDSAAAAADLEQYRAMRATGGLFGVRDGLDGLIKEAVARPIAAADIQTVTNRSFRRADRRMALLGVTLAIAVALLGWRWRSLPTGPWGLKAFFGFSVLFLVIACGMWAWRALFGRGASVWGLFRPMARFNFASENRKWPGYSTGVNAGLAVMLGIGGYGLPWTFYGAGIVLGLGVVLWQILPPTILFLASSSPDCVRTWDAVARAARPHRVVALLAISDPPVHWPVKLDLASDNFRTLDRCLWRLVVHPLMDVVPVIVVDASQETPFVLEEIRRLSRTGALAKTLFIDHEGGGGASPTLKAAAAGASSTHWISPDGLADALPSLLMELRARD